MLKTQFKFVEVKNALSDLPDNGDKIKFLLEVLTEYKQSPGPDLNFLPMPGFAEQCELEIKKLERMIGYQNAELKQIKSKPKKPLSHKGIALAHHLLETPITDENAGKILKQFKPDKQPSIRSLINAKDELHRKKHIITPTGNRTTDGKQKKIFRDAEKCIKGLNLPNTDKALEKLKQLETKYLTEYKRKHE